MTKNSGKKVHSKIMTVILRMTKIILVTPATIRHALKKNPRALNTTLLTISEIISGTSSTSRVLVSILNIGLNNVRKNNPIENKLYVKRTNSLVIENRCNKPYR